MQERITCSAAAFLPGLPDFQRAGRVAIVNKNKSSLLTNHQFAFDEMDKTFELVETKSSLQ